MNDQEVQLTRLSPSADQSRICPTREEQTAVLRLVVQCDMSAEVKCFYT